MRALVVARISARIDAKSPLVSDHGVVPRLEPGAQRRRIGASTRQVCDCVRIHIDYLQIKKKHRCASPHRMQMVEISTTPVVP
jgi:hypothetical protein